jgi:hypothetical protein
MINLTAIEEKIRTVIDDDIEANFGKDPFGDSVYLWFLAKNKIESHAIDNLIDWMNSWIEGILNEGKFSRFVDREFTSALFGYVSLKSIDRLRTKVNINRLNDMISKFVVDDSFFNNFTYSTIILLSLADVKDKVSVFNRVFNRIMKSIDREVIFNDAKNLVFVSVLLDRLDQQDKLRKLVDLCFERVSKSNIRYNDKIYYAWILWNYKTLREERDLPKILDFTRNTLENITRIFGEEIDESVIEMYGYDEKVGFSKILLGTTLDLLINFNKERAISLGINQAYIKQKLVSLGWKNAWRELDRAIRAFEENRTADCCNNLRMGLITTLVKAYEHFEKQQAPTLPGKTTDITPLIKSLQKHKVPKDATSMIRQSWSYVSERAHIEKRGGIQPSRPETLYGLQVTFAAVEFILKFIG